MSPYEHNKINITNLQVYYVGNLLKVLEYDKTYYIPINSNFIKNVDLEKKELIVENIEGLII